MSRNEIASMLRLMLMQGRISSKVATGLNYGAVNKAIAEGRLFQTSFASIVCSDAETRDVFEDFVRKGRIMDVTAVKVQMGLLTQYAITKAAADGRFLRFPDFGNSCVLYID